MLSVIIPSKTEKFLDHTIKDVLKNATGDIEVIPVLDGYDTEEIKDDRVRYIRLPSARNTQKRQGINKAVETARGEHIMSLDAHCMVAEGFDEQLARDHKPNWVQVPRRHRLDAENWCIQDQSDDRPPIDYEYIIFKSLVGDRSIHGFKWDARTKERQFQLIDDIVEFQGSCWFMTKEWFKKNGFMDLKYMGWGQEAEEISFTTWKAGGAVKTNKNTWYAHLHKGKKYGRMYWMSRDECRRSYAYAFNKWLIEEKEFFISLIEKFAPLPGWSTNWKEVICKL